LFFAGDTLLLLAASNARSQTGLAIMQVHAVSVQLDSAQE
jgi:hypothetical protein